MVKLPKEYHDLREYAIGYYRAQAGYIAPNMPICEDFSDIKLWLQLVVYEKHYDDFVGQIRVISVRAELCYECCREMHRLFPTIWFNQHCDVKICVICGRGTDDDIPF